MNSRKLFHLFIILLIGITNNCFSQDLHFQFSMPEYPGGFTALKEFITQNLNYPDKEKNENVTGMVTVNYIINEEGKQENIRILRGINPIYDSEAIRVTRLITGWKPAVQCGKPVRYKVEMPVEFYLSNENKEKEINITGKVCDEYSCTPLENIMVLVLGTSVGALTDKDGVFSLPVPGEDSELEFSYMGYEIKREKVGKNRIINAELSEEKLVIDFNSEHSGN